MRISDWSSDVCSSDLRPGQGQAPEAAAAHAGRAGALRTAAGDAVRHLDRVRHQPAGRPGAAPPVVVQPGHRQRRSEEHTSELQSLMRISYAVFCLKKKRTNNTAHTTIRTRPNSEFTM